MSMRAIVVGAVVAAFTAGMAGGAVSTAAETPMSGESMKQGGAATGDPMKKDEGMKQDAGTMGKEPMVGKEGSMMKKEDSMMKKDAKPAMEKKP